MWINKKYFSQYSPLPIPSNYDYSEIMLYLPIASEIWVRPLIGTELLDRIEEEVENNQVSDEIAALLTEGKLWQYLSYATCLEGLPFLWSNISEVGITLAETDFSKSITLKDLTYIESHLRRQTEFLKDSVKRYICEHSDHYPIADFCACGCSCCSQPSQLNHPNPYQQLYTTRRKCTDLR